MRLMLLHCLAKVWENISSFIFTLLFLQWQMQDIKDCVVLDWDSIPLISAVLLMDYMGIFFPLGSTGPAE